MVNIQFSRSHGDATTGPIPEFNHVYGNACTIGIHGGGDFSKVGRGVGYVTLWDRVGAQSINDRIYGDLPVGHARPHDANLSGAGSVASSNKIALSCASTSREGGNLSCRPWIPCIQSRLKDSGRCVCPFPSANNRRPNSSLLTAARQMQCRPALDRDRDASIENVTLG